MHASLVETLTKFEVQVIYGIAFTFARAFNPIMVFHSVAVVGALIIVIALVLAIHRSWANYRDKKRHGG
jgi:hypothetical protein